MKYKNHRAYFMYFIMTSQLLFYYLCIFLLFFITYINFKDNVKGLIISLLILLSVLGVISVMYIYFIKTNIVHTVEINNKSIILYYHSKKKYIIHFSKIYAIKNDNNLNMTVVKSNERFIISEIIGIGNFSISMFHPSLNKILYDEVRKYLVKKGKYKNIDKYIDKSVEGFYGRLLYKVFKIY